MSDLLPGNEFCTGLCMSVFMRLSAWLFESNWLPGRQVPFKILLCLTLSKLQLCTLKGYEWIALGVLKCYFPTQLLQRVKSFAPSERSDNIIVHDSICTLEMIMMADAEQTYRYSLLWRVLLWYLVRRQKYFWKDKLLLLWRLIVWKSAFWKNNLKKNNLWA